MLYLDAISYDLKILDILNNNATGTIISVYKKAVNVLNKFYDGNRLITFIDSKSENIPLGITLDLLKNKNFLDLGFRKDMKVYMAKECIMIPKNEIVINLKNSNLWSSNRRMIYLNSRIIIKNIEIVNKILLKDNFDYGIIPLINYQNLILDFSKNVKIKENILCRKVYSILRRLLFEIQNGNSYSIKNSILSLVGLGVGLTPSGDDLLLGLIASFYYVHHCYKENKYLFEILDLLNNFKGSFQGKTTVVSEKYLIEAIEGNFSEKLCKFMEIILLSKSVKEVKKYTHKFVLFGSSSGREIIFGIILGLKLGFKLIENERCVLKNGYEKNYC